MLKILGLTTRATSGVAGESVIEHLSLAKMYSNSMDILSICKTDRERKLFFDKCGIVVDNVITDFAQEHLGNLEHYKENKVNWLEIYDSLDVSEYKDYDLLYLVSGLYFPSGNVTSWGNRVGQFPEKYTVTFQTHAIRIVNVLAMLKIHNTYGTPFHEISKDPDELSCHLFHESIAPKIGENYYVYHGYDSPSHDIKRLDSLQHYCKELQPKYIHVGEKDIDLTFGYTNADGRRDKYLPEMEDVIDEFQSKVILARSDIRDKKFKDQHIPRTEYLKYIARSRFTYVLPAYYDKFVSIYRIIESVSLDCLPILSNDTNTEELNESFGYDFDVLKSSNILGCSEEKRSELLVTLKEVLFENNQYLIGVDKYHINNETIDDW